MIQFSLLSILSRNFPFLSEEVPPINVESLAERTVMFAASTGSFRLSNINPFMVNPGTVCPYAEMKTARNSSMNRIFAEKDILME